MQPNTISTSDVELSWLCCAKNYSLISTRFLQKIAHVAVLLPWEVPLWAEKQSFSL